ncbi:unnamed protein product [Ophioblennius macclurei]
MSWCVDRALPLFLLFGLGLRLSVKAELPSRYGYCSGHLCYFQDSLDYEGARKACEEMLGQLFVRKDLELLKDVLVSFGSSVWLGNRTKENRVQICSTASLDRTGSPKVHWQSCSDKLGGFVCQYESGQVCSRSVEAGAPVEYTAAGFRMDVSGSFPPGTIALKQQPGEGHPISKHVCLNSWIKAPWTCEVLSGGCEVGCSKDAKACACPAGRKLHPNGFSCVAEPSSFVSSCSPGEDPCAAGGGKCVPSPDGYECLCQDGFEWEDGACVNVSICMRCEHMTCDKHDGVYRCACKTGFVVSPGDPTKCVRVQNCTQRDCPAVCDPNLITQCKCPDGFVLSYENNVPICTDIDECATNSCDHHCHNNYGSFTCSCREGFQKKDEQNCVRLNNGEEEESPSSSSDVGEDEEASGSEYPTQSSVTAAGLQPAGLPQYIKTGSILGITVFLVLCVVLLGLIARHSIKRCGRFEISTFKHPDLDIYYLQQVSTETYKRLSIDRQLKNDPQRL